MTNEDELIVNQFIVDGTGPAYELAMIAKKETARADNLEKGIRDALYKIGTGTDCQCQGENCPWCNLRYLLNQTIGVAHDVSGREVATVRERLKKAERVIEATRPFLKLHSTITPIVGKSVSAISSLAAAVAEYDKVIK